MEIENIPEQLSSFFRSNCRLMNLPRNFENIQQDGKHLWRWNLSNSDEKIRRSVELSFCSDPSRMIEIIAKVSSLNFWEKNKDNKQRVGILRLNRADSSIKKNRAWIRGELRLASEFALSMSLLDIKLEDSILGTYRDVL